MQGLGVSSISKHKPTLQVSPYFHILALFKLFKLKLQPKLIKQKFANNQFNNPFQNHSSISSSYYVLTATRQAVTHIRESQ
jgi:hypothetical protein